MKRLFNKGLVVFAAATMIATLNVEHVFAQRPSRQAAGFLVVADQVQQRHREVDRFPEVHLSKRQIETVIHQDQIVAISDQAAQTIVTTGKVITGQDFVQV